MKHNLSVKHKIQFTFRCYIVWNIILGERKCIRGLKKNFAYTGKQGSNKTIAKMIVAQGRVNNTHAQKKKKTHNIEVSFFDDGHRYTIFFVKIPLALCV